ncbi:hypothetical protein ACH50O_04030 [Methylomonas sp. 2BW1-5-20]
MRLLACVRPEMTIPITTPFTRISPLVAGGIRRALLLGLAIF